MSNLSVEQVIIPMLSNASRDFLKNSNYLGKHKEDYEAFLEAMIENLSTIGKKDALKHKGLFIVYETRKIPIKTELIKLRKNLLDWYTKAGYPTRPAPKFELSEELWALENKSKEITIGDILTKRFQIYRSARNRGLEFNLTDDDVLKLLERKTCFYTGARFSESNGYTRTIDRVDANKGYVKGNVVACTEKANLIKNQLFESGESKLSLTLPQLYKMVVQMMRICDNNHIETEE